MRRFDKARWDVVSPLLDELLDAGVAQRDAQLRQIQTKDQALADDLASLLAINTQVETEHFLEGSVLDRIGEAILARRLQSEPER